MTALPKGGGDMGKHLVISKSISIEFKKAKRTSKSLEVVFNGDSIAAKFENTDDLTHRWTLDRAIHMLPNSNDGLTLRVVFGKKRGCLKARNDRPEEFQLVTKDVADKFKQSDEISFSQSSCSVTLNVATGYIEDILATISDEELDPLLHVQDVIASGSLFLQNALPLKSILESTRISENALQVLEKTIDILGDAHPLAKAVLTALSIPCKLLRTEHEFKQIVEDLAEAMLSTCKCLMDVRYHTKITSAKELFVVIMKIIRDAALFIELYRQKGRMRQFVAAQFGTRLENYAEDLIKQKNNFQVAILMQIAVDVNTMASMTSDDYLAKRIEPVEQQPLENSCLEGTRVNILREATDWVQDSTSLKNILWIVGAPGVGKSTIATTIARGLADTAPYCATFFCKRDVPQLREPRQIWRALAHSLAVKHDGVKAALMLTLNEKKGKPKDYSVAEQCQILVKWPLETDLKETKSRSPAYPVIIIDALDECYFANDRNWDSLLESLAGWAELPGVFKLVVTSRDHFDLRATLGNVSRQIVLTTGEDVSDDSTSDIRTFFTIKFAAIRATFSLPSDWPSEAVIQEMANYAAGLFIWADIVIKYVGQRTGGCNPSKRLADVLSDIKLHPGNQQSKRRVFDGGLDRLYARILFEAFRHSKRDERNNATRTLAAVVLAKEPLRKSDLIELLLTDTCDSVSVEFTLRELSPIIPIPAGVNQRLRVCHKTVSDFLLSHERSAAAMKYVVQIWTRQMPDEPVSDSRSFIPDCRKESANLALACLQLAHRYLSLDIHRVAELLKQPDGLLYYTHQHWFEHLEASEGNWIPSLKNLADAMKVAYGRLQRYAQQMLSAKEEATALIEHLRDTAKFASQCINPNFNERPLVDLQRGVEEYAMKLDIARGNFQIAMVLNLASDIDQSSTNAPDTFLKKRLEPSSQSLLDDECLKGTRATPLRKAKDWLGDPELPNILWMCGAPGAGKSAIATTLVREFSDTCLCAKVFAKRDFADRRDPRRIWRTLAYNLTCLHVGLRGSIMETLSESSLYSQTASVGDQFRDLVKAMQDQHSLSVVVVIDALDECFAEYNEHWRTLLEAVSGWADLPRAFRLVVTSRDIPDIRGTLAEISYSLSLTTGNKASIEAKSDTRLFFSAKLEEISKDLKDAHPYWRGEEVIQQLVEYAAGSFIWAKMIVELVKLDPVGRRLEDILNGNELGSGDVDILYGKMLFETLGQLHEKERSASRSILVTIVLAKDPLRIVDIVKLLPSNTSNVDEMHRSVESVVEELSSIISVDDNHLLRIPHKSFSDFLLDHDRSVTAMRHFVPEDRELRSYLIDRGEDNANIAIACLRLMSSSLTFNSCGIKTSYCLNDDIPELAGLISNNISTALIYACRFWANHLEDSFRNDWFLRSVQPLLKTLLHEKLLYWLEVLSLVKEAPSAEESLRAGAEFLQEYDNDLAEVAEDAGQFASTFNQAIAGAATHIYLSALSFCPSDSWMARLYGSQYPNLLSITCGRRTNWYAAATTSNGHDDCVTSVAFIPTLNGMKLASGSWDRTVRMWDSRTGKAVSDPLTGHIAIVRCVAASPDGKLIVSSSTDGTLRIWDSNTGACPLGPITAHRHEIRSTALSPDSSRIVSGSGGSGCTVKVWNVTTGDICLGPLTGHTNTITCVTFSPDGKYIASGAYDETIRIWDASTGECRAPLVGHTNVVFCVAFSADGHYLASGSGDETIRLWDVTQGFAAVATTTSLGSSIWSLSLSPKSNYLVSGAGNGEIRFWNISSGNCEQLGEAVHGHSGAVYSVAFSPDGLSVASGSDDRSVKIWTAPNTSTRSQASHQIIDMSTNEAMSLDGRGCPVLSDGSFIDMDGWMIDSRREGSRRLFWVPEENRAGFWWSRNTAVIARSVTQIDFTRFVHGDNWAGCRSDIV